MYYHYLFSLAGWPYTWIVIDDRPKKEDPNHVRITVGGNLIGYLFKLAARTCDMVSSKFLWNSVISTKNVCFAGANIINMYLKTPLDWFEYMKMPNAHITEHNNLWEKAIDGYVYMEIKKGMYC
jgi:hypothetical protein